MATVENGKIWLETVVAEKATHVTEIHEEYRSRKKDVIGVLAYWEDDLIRRAIS